MAIEAGSMFGDYKVLGRLGAGGIGEVYKVRHIISDRVEAMKVLLPERTEGNVSERFLREIRVLASLQHRHIAGLHTAFKVDDRIFMIMEFIEGENLRARLRSSNLNMAEGIRYMTEVLSALEYAHGRGVIHRDIKPSNIMITPQGETRLLDFGLALNRTDANLTRQGHILGSLNYMSPEQIRGEAIDARTDVYSTGVTLYEVLTGRSPIEGPTDYAIMMGHLETEPVPPIELNPNIPRGLSSAVMTALAKDPGYRFQSAAEFSSHLQHSLADDGPTMSRHSLIAPPRHVLSPKSGQAPGKEAASGSSISNDLAMLDSVSRELAAYIGPIAKVVVKRAAPRCSTLQELYAQVAAEIDSEKDRAAFLASRKRRV